MTASPSLPTLDEATAQRLRLMFEDPRFGTHAWLADALRFLSKWRALVIDEAVVKRTGAVVQGGPFKGMLFSSRALEASLTPKLLGTYESELHAAVERIVELNHPRVVNVGCADGYYAIGLARRMPNSHVFAFDIEARAQESCSGLASLNTVADRVIVSGACTGDDLARLIDAHTFILIDAEGAEDELLRPDLYPALRFATLLVECHPKERHGITRKIIDRFAPTHNVEIIRPRLQIPPLPEWMIGAAELDQLLTVWEWRASPTPWLFLTPK